MQLLIPKKSYGLIIISALALMSKVAISDFEEFFNEIRNSQDYFWSDYRLERHRISPILIERSERIARISQNQDATLAARDEVNKRIQASRARLAEVLQAAREQAESDKDRNEIYRFISFGSQMISLLQAIDTASEFWISEYDSQSISDNAAEIDKEFGALLQAREHEDETTRVEQEEIGLRGVLIAPEDKPLVSSLGPVGGPVADDSSIPERLEEIVSELQASDLTNLAGQNLTRNEKLIQEGFRLLSGLSATDADRFVDENQFSPASASATITNRFLEGNPLSAGELFLWTLFKPTVLGDATDYGAGARLYFREQLSKYAVRYMNMRAIELQFDPVFSDPSNWVDVDEQMFECRKTGCMRPR